MKTLFATIKSPIVYLNASGMTTFFGSFALLNHVYPDSMHPNLAWPLLLLGWATSITLLLISVFPIIDGRWSMRRWGRYYFWIFLVPVGLLFAITAAAAGEYYYFVVIFLAGGLISAIGYVSLRGIASGGLIFTVLLAGFLYWLQPELYERRLLALLLLYFGLVWLSLMLGILSRFVLNESRSVQKLLRSARRDKRTIASERRKADDLLRNILPDSIARELKETGKSNPVSFENATVLFTDFQGFTKIAAGLQPDELIGELDRCFSYFDSLMDRYNLEKLKTIGDSFMCAGGLPEPNKSHAVDCVLAAFEIQAFMEQMKAIKAEQGFPYWELRLGIHSGPLVAGVIGEKKFAYDIWGDTVNTASRMESSGESGRINISGETFELVKDFFLCSYRGRVTAKGKGEIDMYFVESLRPELSVDGGGRVPNARFDELKASR